MAERRDYGKKELDEFVRTGDDVAMVELLSTVTHSPAGLVQEDINKLVGYKEPVPAPEPARTAPRPSPGMSYDGAGHATGTSAAVRQRRDLERQSLEYLARQAHRETYRHHVRAHRVGPAPFVFLLVVLILALVFHV